MKKRRKSNKGEFMCAHIYIRIYTSVRGRVRGRERRRGRYEESETIRGNEVARKEELI